MTTIISRKIEYSDRFASQQADQAIGGDVIRALVELITNVDDSYKRLESDARQNTGRITIEVKRHLGVFDIKVSDDAEGLSGKELEQKVGKYAEATSGMLEGKSVRGMLGRGLKDAIFGLGNGEIISGKDGQLHVCRLFFKGSQPTFELDEPIRLTNAIRQQYELVEKHGTSVRVKATKENIRVPQFETLRRRLEKHFEVRAILSNPKRNVSLIERDSRGHIRQEIRLEYQAPIGEKVLDKTFDVPEYPANVHLDIFRATEPLTMPSEDREYAEGGLSFISHGVSLTLTFLKFDNNEFASRLYGTVTCDYFHSLMQQDQQVVTATRDGINWRHPFCKTLKKMIEECLEPLIEKEKEKAQNNTSVNKSLQRKLDSAIEQLNMIAKEELGPSGLSGEEEGPNAKEPRVPVGGFGFVPEYASIQSGKTASLALRAIIPDIAQNGELVSFQSSGAGVRVLTPTVGLTAREDSLGIGEARVELEGRQIGYEAIITARMGHREANALVRVVSRSDHMPPKPPQPKQGGLITEIIFSEEQEPRQRVVFRSVDKVVIVATRAPSVAMYFGLQGQGQETSEALVLLSELVTDAVCREIARRGVRNGKFPAFTDAETDAIQLHYLRLQNKYSHVIHNALRTGKLGPKKKGRLPRAIALADAATPI